MNFSKYVNNNWDMKRFCHDLANEAKYDIYKIFIEMALGTGEIPDPKYPILPDADDYRFLIQFPYKVWAQALNWRYNQGLREIIKSRDPKKGKAFVPEGWDYTNKFVLPAPHGSKYIFGSDNGDKNIYVGLTTLLKKLSAPPKGYPGDITKSPDKPGEAHPLTAKEGPSLKEIDPNATDESNPLHPKHYKGGLYNFDPDDLAEVTDEDIEEIPDSEIQAWLPSPLSDKDLDDPEVQKAIKKIRARMKFVPKHTMAGYSVPQKYATQKDLGNWIIANSTRTPQGGALYGEHPHTYKDESGNVYNIEYIGPSEVHKKISGNLNPKSLKTGEYDIKNNIPVIRKNIKYHIVDKRGKVKSVNQEETLPYLNPMRGLPQLRVGLPVQITDDQKRQIAIRRKPDVANWWPQGVPVDELMTNMSTAEVAKLKALIKVDTLRNFLNFWDIWTPEQKEFVWENAKSLHHIARHVFGKSEESKDLNAAPINIYGGFRPNYLTPAQGKVEIPPELMGKFIAKYLPKMELELTAYSEEEAQHAIKTALIKGKGEEKELGKMDKFLNSMEKSGDYPPQVIEGLRNRKKDLVTFCSYLLLTFLNDPQLGIKDNDFELLKNIPEGEVDEKANELRRFWKVQWFLKSIAQIGFDDTLSRRYREKFGVPSLSELSKFGATGKSMEADIDEGQAKKDKGGMVLSLPAKRRWFHSSMNHVARAGQKLNNKVTAALQDFMTLRRKQILRKLNGNSQANTDLTGAEDNITKGVENAIALFHKYEKELMEKIPDPAKREEEVMKLVQQDLKNGVNYNDLETEEILQKAKTIHQAGKMPVNAQEIVGPMDHWMDDFMHLDVDKHEKLQLITYDEAEGKVIQGSKPITPSLMPPTAHATALLIHQLYQYPILVHNALHKWGLKIFSKIYEAHYGEEAETDEEMEAQEQKIQQEWAAELAKWDKNLTQQYGVAAPTTTAPAAVPAKPISMPQQQQPTAPVAAAAKSIPELFNMATTVSNTNDVINVAKALLDKKQELIAQPGSANKLFQTMKAMQQRMAHYNVELNQQSWNLIKELNKMRIEIQRAQETGH